ncbi:replication protein P [Caballeronia sp. Sq4a]|uniref:replication protein P n=1 Tax=Caballeronia sp. Sq4a TaxID=2878152 RepID=UPI0020BD602C|nr:replication protein P [Caballeronia sp. Sq4a]
MLKPSKWHEPHPKLGISLMDHLFNRLDGMYPNRWRAAFQSEQAIANWRDSWAEAFDEDGVTTQMISDGIRACRKHYDWPPSVSEFIKACKPPLDIDAAVYEAIDQMRARQHGKDVWSNPAIFWAAVKVGEYDVISQTVSQLKPRFEAALKKVLEAGDIQPVPARVPALAAPGAAESTREYGRQRLDELNASAAMKNMSKGGNIEWARRIIEDERATGTVPLNKLKIARDAIFNVTGKQA